MLTRRWSLMDIITNGEEHSHIGHEVFQSAYFFCRLQKLNSFYLKEMLTRYWSLMDEITNEEEHEDVSEEAHIRLRGLMMTLGHLEQDQQQWVCGNCISGLFHKIYGFVDTRPWPAFGIVGRVHFSRLASRLWRSARSNCEKCLEMGET